MLLYYWFLVEWTILCSLLISLELIVVLHFSISLADTYCLFLKDVRIAAMECMEELYKLLQHFDASSVKNGLSLFQDHCSEPSFTLINCY